MPEELNDPASPQAGGTDPIQPQPQAGNTPPTHPQAGESQPHPARSAEESEHLIAELRKEAAERRVKLKSFEDAERVRQEADLSEKQKLEKRLADQQKEHADYVLQNQDRLIASELRAHAARLGFADPADAVAMIRRAELEFADDGMPTNAEALLQTLLKAKPYLAGKAPAPAPTAGGASNPSRSQAESGEITAAYVAEVMSGRIDWHALTKERQTAVLNWQSKNSFRF